MKSYSALTPVQRRSLWMGFVVLFSILVSICLRAGSSINHQHVYLWLSDGFEALGFLCALLLIWNRYHDSNTPYK